MLVYRIVAASAAVAVSNYGPGVEAMVIKRSAPSASLVVANSTASATSSDADGLRLYDTSKSRAYVRGGRAGADSSAKGKAHAQVQHPIEQLQPWVDRKTTPVVNFSETEKSKSASSKKFHKYVDVGTTAEYEAAFTAFVKSSTTRFVGNKPEVQKAEKFITDKFASMSAKQSLPVDKQPFKITAGGQIVTCDNIVARYDLGLKRSAWEMKLRKTIVVGAHYDSIPSSGPAPGADDNASGVAALLSIATQVVKYLDGLSWEEKEQVKYEIVFVAFSAEEMGLLGSEHFVNVWRDAHKEAGGGGQIYEALIMDQIGFKKNSDGVANMIFETAVPHDKRVTATLQSGAVPQQHLIDVLGRTATALSLYSNSGSSGTDLSVNYDGFGSDHMPFLNAGMPAVLLIERDNLYYADHFGHTRMDVLGNIDFDYARKMANTATNAVLTLLLE